MNVSFKGFQNPGYNGYVNFTPVMVNDGQESFVMPKMIYKNLHVELNNKNGNHKDEYKDILECFPNDYKSNAIDIEISDIYEKDTNNKQETILSLNKVDIPLDKNTLPLFQEVNELVKKFAKTPDEQIERDEHYGFTENGINSFKPMFKIIELCEQVKELPFIRAFGILNDAFSPEYTEKGAQAVSKSLTECIDKFEKENE